MAKRTINTLWSGLSTNRLSFSEEEIGAGILYKGAVVSNQLNGIAYNLYDMLDFVQRTGGFYNAAKKYHLNNVVSILRKDLSGPLRMEQYLCVADVEGGIVNKPPILRAAYDPNAKVPIFEGGAIDTANWQRCDVVGYGEIYQERTNFDFVKDIKLFGINTLASIDSPSQRIYGEYDIVVYFEDKVTSMHITLDGSYTKTLNNEVVIMPNRLGATSPEISISRYRSSITDYGDENDFHQLMPCGLRFQYSNAVRGDNGIFLRLRDGVKKITIRGSGEYIDVQLNRDVEPLSDYIVIPARSDGGFADFDEIGMLQDRDYNLPVEMQYKMGLFKLLASTAYDGEDKTLSPLWGRDPAQTSALFTMLAKVRGSYKIPKWQGVFRRNLGENLIQGVPQDTPARPLASLQGDAIRDIKGAVDTNRGTYWGRDVGKGAFETEKKTGTGDVSWITGSNNHDAILKFAASRVVPTSFENRPTNVAVQYYYKAF